MRVDKPLIDTVQNVVSFRGMNVKITPREMDVMSVLVETMPRALEMSDLASRVWPEGASNDLLRQIVYNLNSRLQHIGFRARVGLTDGVRLYSSDSPEGALQGEGQGCDLGWHDMARWRKPDQEEPRAASSHDWFEVIRAFATPMTVMAWLQRKR